MPEDISLTVSCTSISTTILQKAEVLAKKLHLDFVDPGTAQSGYTLVLSDSHLALHRVHGANDPHETPLTVDFTSGKTVYRHVRETSIKQPIARAIGIKQGFRPEIFDATAGLGGDSFVFASLGCNVQLNERSPIVGALLEDGIRRALEAGGSIAEAAARMSFSVGDAATELLKHTGRFHTIYLDPMYPHLGKSALNKKEMRYLRDIVGRDEDADVVLPVALKAALKRCVVKRPKGAPYLAGLTPSYEVKMKSSRFDIYICPYL